MSGGSGSPMISCSMSVLILSRFPAFSGRINGLRGSEGVEGLVGPRCQQLKSCCIGMGQRLVPRRLSWIFPFLLGRGQ